MRREHLHSDSQCVDQTRAPSVLQRVAVQHVLQVRAHHAGQHARLVRFHRQRLSDHAAQGLTGVGTLGRDDHRGQCVATQRQAAAVQRMCHNECHSGETVAVLGGLA